MPWPLPCVAHKAGLEGALPNVKQQSCGGGHWARALLWHWTPARILQPHPSSSSVLAVPEGGGGEGAREGGPGKERSLGWVFRDV